MSEVQAFGKLKTLYDNMPAKESYKDGLEINLKGWWK